MASKLSTGGSLSKAMNTKPSLKLTTTPKITGPIQSKVPTPSYQTKLPSSSYSTSKPAANNSLALNTPLPGKKQNILPTQTKAPSRSSSNRNQVAAAGAGGTAGANLGEAILGGITGAASAVKGAFSDEKPTYTDSYNGRTGSSVSTFSNPLGRTNEGMTLDQMTKDRRGRIETQDRLSSQMSAIEGQLGDAQRKVEEKKAAAQAAAAAIAPKVQDDMENPFVDSAMQSMTDEMTMPDVPAPITPPAPVFDEENDPDAVEARRLEKQMQAIMQELEGAKAPTTEELEAENQLRNIISNSELGKAAVAEQPIPTGFISGQQSAIERRAGLAAMPLEAQIALMQGKRKQQADQAAARLNSSEFRLGRFDDRLSEKKKRKRDDELYARGRADDLEDERRKLAQPFEMSEGQSLVRLNPVTGKLETLRTIPKTYAPKTPGKSVQMAPTYEANPVTSSKFSTTGGLSGSLSSILGPRLTGFEEVDKKKKSSSSDRSWN